MFGPLFPSCLQKWLEVHLLRLALLMTLTALLVVNRTRGNDWGDGGGGGGWDKSPVWCCALLGRYTALNAELARLASELPEGPSSVSTLAAHVHVYPDYHGNRSPLADPSMTAAVCGLTLDESLASAAIMYLATVLNPFRGVWVCCCYCCCCCRRRRLRRRLLDIWGRKGFIHHVCCGGGGRRVCVQRGGGSNRVNTFSLRV